MYNMCIRYKNVDIYDYIIFIDFGKIWSLYVSINVARNICKDIFLEEKTSQKLSYLGRGINIFLIEFSTPWTLSESKVLLDAR